MSVKLREKKLSSGEASFYLDIYHNKRRWYEFLEIHYNPKKPTSHDKENKRLAQEIRAKREHDLIVLGNGLKDKRSNSGDFIHWFEEVFMPSKNSLKPYSSALLNLKLYMGGKPKRIKGMKFAIEGTVKPLPFAHITPEWITGFKHFLLDRVSNNSARAYLFALFSALKEAERKDIIRKNPFKLLEKGDWLKKEDIFRTAWQIDQLQLLADAPCNINEQIKLLYFFSCFTGLRWGDANCLKWDEIIQKNIQDKEMWFIYFKQEKTTGIEYLPLSEQAIRILKERLEASAKQTDKSPYVFDEMVECESNKYIHRKVNAELKKWAKAAGLDPEKIKFHTGRHTFATNVLEASDDGNLATVSKLLGHKSIKITEIYAKVRDRQKALAVNALPTINLRQPRP